MSWHVDIWVLLHLMVFGKPKVQGPSCFGQMLRKQSDLGKLLRPPAGRYNPKLHVDPCQGSGLQAGRLPDAFRIVAERLFADVYPHKRYKPVENSLHEYYVAACVCSSSRHWGGGAFLCKTCVRRLEEEHSGWPRTATQWSKVWMAQCKALITAPVNLCHWSLVKNYLCGLRR